MNDLDKEILQVLSGSPAQTQHNAQNNITSGQNAEVAPTPVVNNLGMTDPGNQLDQQMLSVLMQPSNTTVSQPEVVEPQPTDVNASDASLVNKSNKTKIVYTRAPMTDVVSDTPSMPREQNPNEDYLVNTTRTAPRGTVTQHINDNYPDSARLVSEGGDAYLGGSVSPNSSVRAQIRLMDDKRADPFWLESTDRFAPVGDWTVKLPILKEPVKLKTTDVDKAAHQIAVQYQGVPDIDFFGYEYMPAEDYHETWWSSFWTEEERQWANTLANTSSAIVGMFSEEEAAKTPEMRAQENREASGYLFNYLRRKSQEYLDYVNDMEPMPRHRFGEITAVTGSATPSLMAKLGGIASGSWVGWAASGGASTLLSATETMDTRDAVLKSGGTVGEAQKAQWKHMGAIGVTEVASTIAGQSMAQGLVRAAVNRGASKALTAVVGAGAQLAIASPIDATTEVIQDKYGTIAAGKAGYESMFGWSREDWNTFYGTLLFGALSAHAGAIEGVKEYQDVAKTTDNYLAMAAQLKRTLIESAAKNGVTVTPEVSAKLDTLIMDIWKNPDKTFDENMRAVAQGFYDKLLNTDPEVAARAQQLIDTDLANAQQLSARAFSDYDARIKAQPWYNDLDEAEQQSVLGIMRGMAYVGAFFFGQSPSEIVIPSFERGTTEGAWGSYTTPAGLSAELNTAQVNFDRAEALLDELINRQIEANPDIFGTSDAKAALKYLDEYLNRIAETGDITWPEIKRQDVASTARFILQSNPDVSSAFNNYIAASEGLNATKNSMSEGGRVRIQNKQDYNPNARPNYIKATKQYDDTYNNPVLTNINTLLHEFSHANDWRLNKETVNDLSEFIEWYTSAISEVFGKQRAQAVANAMAQDGGSNLFAMNVQPKDYKSAGRISENRAQAVGRLLNDAKDYIGLTGKPAQYIQAVNALLQGMNEVTPLPNGLSEYVAALQDYVKANSDVIRRIRDKVPAERLNAAIKSYMGGNEIIDWQGVTPKTLEEFAQASTYPLDADALQYSLTALGDTNVDDFVDKAVKDWDIAWGKIGYTRDKPLSETEQISDVRLKDIDGGVNPEDTQELIEDWESEQAMVQKALGQDPIDDLIEYINQQEKKKPSEFKKKTTLKFNGQTIQESMQSFLDNMKNHKFVKTILDNFDFVRGTPAFLSSLGGEALVKQFDLVARYDDYSNLAVKFNEGLIKNLAPLFGGSRTKYEDYVRRTGVRKYEVQYLNPATKEKETRLFSKRELMSAILYNEQPDSKERIALTVDDAEVRKHLDDFDIKFAHVLRDTLANDYRRIKTGAGVKNVPVNYFPIMDSYAQEKGSENIINDLGRKNTDEPIGLVDVMNVMGSYMSRVAGTQSGYFAAIRRLNSILNYNARAEETREMTGEDMELNKQLDKMSTQIGQEIRNRLGASNFERFRDNVRDIIEHRNNDELKDSLVSKIARNSLTKLIYGKTKQFAINVGNMFSYLGYEHNSYHSYIIGLVKSLANPVKSWRLAMENDTLRNRRNLYRYNEYMEKNLSANSDNLLTYLANWATRKDLKKLEAITDLVIHVGAWTKRVLAEPLREGDFLGNAIGYAASYDAAVRALGSEEAARRSLSEFLNTRQSTSNQAVKGLMVRKANRMGFWGNIFAFTGEPTQKWGSVAQNVNRMMSGDLSVEKGTRDIAAQTATQLAYVAVQSGIVMLALMPFMGGDTKDEDWDKVYDNVYKETLGVLAGIGGPLTNAVVQPLVNQIAFGYDVNGISLPGLAWMADETKSIKKAAYDEAIYNMLDVAGITSGLTNFMGQVNGISRYAEGKNRKERNAGLWMMEGRSEGMANRLAGVKKSKKKR